MNLNAYRVTAHDERGNMLFLVQDPHAPQHLEFTTAKEARAAVRATRQTYTYDFDTGEFDPVPMDHYKMFVPQVVTSAHAEIHRPS